MPHGDGGGVRSCELRLVHERLVKNTGGRRELRQVVETDIELGGVVWQAQITLTDRTDMGVPMLLGRATIRERFLVHPAGRSSCRAPSGGSASAEEARRRDMKIALLTRNPKLFSHQRIIEAARSRGHEIVPVDYLRCYMNITSRKPELRYLGERLEGFDAVIPAHRRLAHLLRPRGVCASSR